MLACPAAQMKGLGNQRMCVHQDGASLVTVGTGDLLSPPGKTRSCIALSTNHAILRCPNPVSFQKAPKLLLPKGNYILLSAVMQMGSTFRHYQAANLKFVCFAISEFITKTGCGCV